MLISFEQNGPHQILLKRGFFFHDNDDHVLQTNN